MSNSSCLFLACLPFLAPVHTLAASLVYVASGDAPGAIYTINGQNNTVFATLAAPGPDPQALAVSADGAYLYLENGGDGNVYVIQAATGNVVATVGFAPDEIGSLALAPGGQSLWVSLSQSNRVAIIDLATETVTAYVGVGSRPVGIAFNPTGTTALVANTKSNTVTVIDTALLTVLTTVTTGNQTAGVAVSPSGTLAYATNLTDGTVSVIDLTGTTVTPPITVGAQPFGVVFTPDGQYAYVANGPSNNVSVISTASSSVITTISIVADYSYDRLIAISPDGTRAYVTNLNSGNISVIDTTSNSEVATIATGASPEGIATALLPSLTVTPPTLAFSYQQGASSPVAQNVTVSSSGVAFNFAVAATTKPVGTWLSVSPTTGTTETPSGSLAISVNAQRMPVGAYSGTITITSTAAVNSPVTLPVIFTVTPRTPVTRPMSLKSITGWNAEPEVSSAQWQGQPIPPDTTVGKYYLFYAIDACETGSPCNGIKNTATGPKTASVKEPVQWILQGSGFCPSAGCQGIAGSLVFSDPFITPALVKAKDWTADTITFTPAFAPNVSFQYTNNPNVSVTITAPDGATQQLPLPSIPGQTPDCSPPLPCGAVATIATRGYGQCTWFVANQLLMNKLPIPVDAYNITGNITASYLPQQWDVLDFGTPKSATEINGDHTAIITSPVLAKQQTNAHGTTTTYTFTIGEMNVSPAWGESASSVMSQFAVNSSLGIETRIYSDYCWPANNPTNYCADNKRYAIAYYRPLAPQ